MAGLEEESTFNCPYCVAVNSIQVDKTAGRRQAFVTDCEICCRPIDVEVEIDEEGYVSVITKREGDG